MVKAFKYPSEAQMIADFILYAEARGYNCYPESCGYDLFMVCRKTGYQIGLEGKQSFNSKVIDQASPIKDFYNSISPDFVCCLVPEGGKAELVSIADKLNVTIIRSYGELIGNPKNNRCKSRRYKCERQAFEPNLPDFTKNNYWNNKYWYDLCPIKRCTVPEYKPDVIAGVKSPIMLTPWKIKAIKICCVLERRGYVMPKDFRELKIHQSLWSQRRWIIKGDKRGKWIKGNIPDFKNQHPSNYLEICEDISRWATGHLRELINN